MNNPLFHSPVDELVDDLLVLESDLLKRGYSPEQISAHMLASACVLASDSCDVDLSTFLEGVRYMWARLELQDTNIPNPNPNPTKER